jgi:hypothetical protein
MPNQTTTRASVFAAMVTLTVTGTAHSHLIAKPKKPLERVERAQQRNLNHARYVASEGSGRPAVWHRRATRWISRELAETRQKLATKMSPRAAICAVFGSYCVQAWQVALCEGGHPVPSVHARNGQYLGMFQMGDYARSRYGHSWTAYGQARSAYAYFVDSGRDWSPWSCKPW